MTIEARVDRVEARAYTIPTDAPESDGTSSWTKTTIVVAHAHGGGREGIGYTYADPPTAGVVSGMLAGLVQGRDALDPPGAWKAMQAAVRNLGRVGIAATAISAVDVALWDLKAKLLGLPLASLIGRFRERVPIYGSGGFTSYDDRRLAEQLAGWVERDGCR